MFAPAVMYCHLLAWAHSSALCVWDLSKSGPLCSYKPVIVHTPIHLGGMLRPYLKAQQPILQIFGLNTDCLTSDKLAPSAVERLTCCCLQQKEKKHCQVSDSKYLPRKCKSELKVFRECRGSVLILFHKHYSMNLFHSTVFSYLCKAVNAVNSFELCFSQSCHESLWLHCN